MTKVPRLVAGTVLLSGLLLAACAGGTSAGPSSAAPPAPSAAPAPSATTTPTTTSAPSATSAPPATSAPAPAAASPQPAATPPPARTQDALVAKGEEVFQKTAGGVGCQACHSKDAKGAIGPDIRGASVSRIAFALSNVDQMAFIKLSPEEVQAVSAYLRSLATGP